MEAPAPVSAMEDGSVAASAAARAALAAASSSLEAALPAPSRAACSACDLYLVACIQRIWRSSDAIPLQPHL